MRYEFGREERLLGRCALGNDGGGGENEQKSCAQKECHLIKVLLSIIMDEAVKTKS
jgi:hypothetical protein